MSADPTPLTDEEIAELERQDHAPDRRLLATIRQRTQERDEAVHEKIDRGARLIIAERQRDEAVALLGKWRLVVPATPGSAFDVMIGTDAFLAAAPGSRDREEGT